MSLELWNTVFAGLTFAVIAATAIAALIQLRHLRAANQLDALLTLMEMWSDEKMHDNIKYVRTELQSKLKDPSFLAGYRRSGISRAEHPELLVGDFWEQVGSFMKYGLVDEAPWLDAAAPQVVRAWNDLEPAITTMREAFGRSSFENFEYAAVRARLWVARYPDGNYPAHTPRMSQMKSTPSTRT